MSSPSSTTLTLVPVKGDLVVCGDDAADQVKDRPAGTFVQVAPGGARQGLAIHADGTLAMWGTDATGITDPAPVGSFIDAAVDAPARWPFGTTAWWCPGAGSSFPVSRSSGRQSSTTRSPLRLRWGDVG